MVPSRRSPNPPPSVGGAEVAAMTSLLGSIGLDTFASRTYGCQDARLDPLGRRRNVCKDHERPAGHRPPPDPERGRPRLLGAAGADPVGRPAAWHEAAPSLAGRGVGRIADAAARGAA